MVKHQTSPPFPTQTIQMEKPILLNSTSQPPFLITQNLFTLQIPSSALSIGSNSSQIKSRSRSRSSPVLVSCRGHEPTEKQEKREKKQQPMMLLGFDKLGKNLKENLSPKQKGDWKDVMLMSLSFAVYVYISQRIVCAYCAWTSMAPNHPW
ncbi:hypothetical protein ACFX12_028625 [Malus domestica]